MSKTNILIVPAGSGMAISAIESLKDKKDIRIISADSDKLAAGLFLSDAGYMVPKFTDNGFIPAIKEIALKEKIDIIIPALDTVLYMFSELKKDFKKTNILVSDRPAIETTRDKWKTYQALKNIIPLPKSFIKKEDINIDYPLFIKPRQGSGSQNAYKLNSKEELDFYYKIIDDPIIQEYLEGDEYTIDCLNNMEGKLLLSVPRQRIEAKAGISRKGMIVNYKILEEMAGKISSNIKLSGPWFFQAKKDGKGNFKLTEVNARISGTMSFTSFSGNNIHYLAIKMIMGKKIGKIKPVKNMYVTRYLKDIYLTEKIIQKKLKKNI